MLLRRALGTSTVVVWVVSVTLGAADLNLPSALVADGDCQVDDAENSVQCHLELIQGPAAFVRRKSTGRATPLHYDRKDASTDAELEAAVDGAGLEVSNRFYDISQGITSRFQGDPIPAEDCWLVKNSEVHIAAHFSNITTGHFAGTQYMTELAVAGPFLQNNSLFITNETTEWDGEKILTTAPSEYLNSLLKAKYHTVHLVQDKNKTALAPGLELELPLGVTMLVNKGQNGIGVQISMPQELIKLDVPKDQQQDTCNLDQAANFMKPSPPLEEIMKQA